MDANSSYAENGIIDYGILHTVSFKFDRDFKKFKENIEGIFSTIDISGESDSEKYYIEHRYRINKNLCYYEDGIGESKEKDLLRNIFLYRNKALSDKISEKTILISGPSISFNTTNFGEFPSRFAEWEKGTFNASTFFLVSESIFTIVALIKPDKCFTIYNLFADEGYSGASEIICRLQKPQDLEVKINTINTKWKKHMAGTTGSLLEETKTYFLSEIFARLYGFSIILLWNKSNLNEKSIQEQLDEYSENRNRTLDIFDTTLFTTVVLFCSPSIFKNPTFIEKIPNLLYGYDKVNASHL